MLKKKKRKKKKRRVFILNIDAFTQTVLRPDAIYSLSLSVSSYFVFDFFLFFLGGGGLLYLFHYPH